MDPKEYRKQQWQWAKQAITYLVKDTQSSLVKALLHSVLIFFDEAKAMEDKLLNLMVSKDGSHKDGSNNE